MEFFECNDPENRRYKIVQVDDHIGKALATTNGWHISETPGAVGNNTSKNNLTGFSAFPAGLCNPGAQENLFFAMGERANFWSSTEGSRMVITILR